MAPEYSIETQSKIVLAVCALHNFIVQHDPDDAQQYDNMKTLHQLNHQRPVVNERDHYELERAGERRESIAKAMWLQYQEYIATE